MNDETMDYDEMTSQSQHDLEDQVAEYVDDYDEDRVTLEDEEALLLEALVQAEPGDLEDARYFVTRGEQLQRIAHMTGKKAADIAALNPHVDFAYLSPGTSVRLS